MAAILPKEDALGFQNAFSPVHSEWAVLIMKRGTTRMSSQSSPIQSLRSLLLSQQNLSMPRKRKGVVKTPLLWDLLPFS
jgi:hypothetical protein